MASIYKPGESGVFYAQVLNGDGTPANAATVTLTVWKSDGSKFLDGVSMSYITGSNGMYKYAFTAPATVERMVADVASTSPTAYGTEDIYVAGWANDIVSVKAKTDLIGASVALESGGNLAAVKAQTDKFLFDVSNFVKSIAQNSELARLDVDVSSRETPAHATALASALALQIDDLITRAKGLNEIYDNVALRALEATLTAIKGAGWTEETLYFIRDLIDALSNYISDVDDNLVAILTAIKGVGWTDETLKAIKDAISGGTDPQAIRDSMKLAPSAGAPAAESIDKHLDDLVSGEEPSKAKFSI